MDESLIIEIWDTFREYISEKNRDTAAEQYIDYLLGKDIEPEVLEGFLGYDPHLDYAINAVIDQSTESIDDFSDAADYDEDDDT